MILGTPKLSFGVRSLGKIWKSGKLFSKTLHFDFGYLKQDWKFPRMILIHQYMLFRKRMHNRVGDEETLNGHLVTRGMELQLCFD